MTSRWLKIAIAFNVLVAAAPRSSEAFPACAPVAGPTHHVIRVIDGNTVVLDDNREARLIGALTPKLALGAVTNTPEDAEARRVLEELVAGRQVTLRFAGRREDRYGRMLAQLFVAGPDGETWVQQHLIRLGHAWAFALPGNADCLRDFLEAEAEARHAKRGLWFDGRFSVLDAVGDVDRLSGKDGQFVIVQGIVRQAARTKETAYLNFGETWRTDFTASVATRVLEKSGASSFFDKLTGRSVRVRGWIERRNGPMISLTAIDEIEIVDTSEASIPLTSLGRIIPSGEDNAPAK